MFGVYLESPEFVVMIMAAITIVLLKICVYNRHFFSLFLFFFKKNIKVGCWSHKCHFLDMQHLTDFNNTTHKDI